MLRSIAFGILALALPVAAFASAVAESLSGQVQMGGVPIFEGQRIAPQSTITTGAAAQVLLRFDDGMQIMLNENSSLRLVDYRGGSNGRAVFDLMSGAARVVTGAVARDNPKQFFFRTPHTQLGVEQPSDFAPLASEDGAIPEWMERTVQDVKRRLQREDSRDTHN